VDMALLNLRALRPFPLKAVQRIRKGAPFLPVGVVRAGEKDPSPEELMGAGADFVAERPIDMERLVGLISQVLSGRERVG
jgi:DNA-binding NarL/FixJ family response regulator